MNERLRLDCESRESAEASLLKAFGCSSEALKRFVADTSHLAYFEENWQRLPEFDRFYLQRARKTLGTPTLPTEVCWFHCTRVAAGTTFEEGILPLGAVLPRLKAALLAALDDPASKVEVEQAFAREGGFGFHFRNKLQQPVNWGPYAIMVREVAAHANALGQHDYVRMPEIVEDLCEDVQLASGLDLLPVFESQWRSAIVKFVAPAGESGEFALAVALQYLRTCAAAGRPGHGAVWCFDGDNKAVAPGQVLRVDFV